MEGHDNIACFRQRAGLHISRGFTRINAGQATVIRVYPRLSVTGGSGMLMDDFRRMQ